MTPTASGPRPGSTSTTAGGTASGQPPAHGWSPRLQPRRFYRRAEAGPLPDGDPHGDPYGGWGVLLDGRPARTPARQPLRLPTPALAEAVASEWDAQAEHIEPDTMPLTRLANTALERVAADRAGIVAVLLDHVDGDVLCYRADHPTDLAARQMADWQPLLDWADQTLAARLAITHGIMPIRQPSPAVAALRTALEDLDDWTLTGAQGVAAAAGSLVLALALARGRVDGESCFALSRLDETYQMARWGADTEATRVREAVRRDILAAEHLVRLSRADHPCT
ncbi:ATP12 family chaperone protein [Roseospira visakhapatnamensis]|uniref:Chaperone required for assembly of F1-ATPase n=1 Tax=Roseospira visakhapatnamensis TaxID=390880 RepID=A0A7W6WB19_9PROT|nr:ATP12 family protein [Roseospira visakhapatnamensis]MBB4267378.1 chaperone required for assembly of F1-ATPase [Roseospira visakhapatnamensis]